MINVPVGNVCWFTILILGVFLFLLVLYSALRCFFPGILAFSSHQKYLILLNHSNLCESTLFVGSLYGYWKLTTIPFFFQRNILATLIFKLTAHTFAIQTKTKRLSVPALPIMNSRVMERLASVRLSIVSSCVRYRSENFASKTTPSAWIFPCDKKELLHTRFRHSIFWEGFGAEK